MSDGFRAYLDAKYALDDRSLNRSVRENLKNLLTAKPQLRYLDIGSGTGAMPRRLIASDLCGSLDITVLDQDADLLDAARKNLTRRLIVLGFRIETGLRKICAYSNVQTLCIRFECASLFDWLSTDRKPDFDLISAHAFMDIVPLQAAIEKIHELLAPGGIFYATLNYDGETALIPVYSDEEFESNVLTHYDASMEKRRINGLASGGARSGRRLVGALMHAGFFVHSYGSSDWNITPTEGIYRDQDRICLKSLLNMIHGEASGHADFRPAALDAWYSDRNRAVNDGNLGMIVHQMDVLALKSAPSGV